MTEAVVKELVEKYPFLLPRNVFTDKIPEKGTPKYCSGYLNMKMK